MDNSFLVSLSKLELMAFFSGYPLVYAVARSFSGNLKEKLANSIASLLPLAYALTGVLFMGYQLKKLFPDYSIENITHSIQQPYLVLWGLFATLFFIPFFNKKPVLSLIHSFVFFYFLISDLYLQLFQSSANNNIIVNDMKVYVSSLLLNMSTLIIVVLLSFLFTYYKKHKKLLL